MSCRTIATVPASRSTSVHFNPQSSPFRAFQHIFMAFWTMGLADHQRGDVALNQTLQERRLECAVQQRVMLLQRGRGLGDKADSL
jgi:hypothetical protein